MMFEVPATRKEAIVQHLRDEIVSGRLAPGTLIRDADVAARLGVSITPVREAVTQLGAEGLIDLAPNRGRRVSQLTKKSALELTEVMEVLAGAGVQWGAHHLTDAQIDALRRCYDEMVESLDAGDIASACDRCADFSTLLISPSDNRELNVHIDLLAARARRLLVLYPDSIVWGPWVTGYRETLELLERGDRPRAVERYRRIYAEYRTVLRTLDFG